MTTPEPVRYVLLPGRHHLLTGAQAAYLGSLLAGQVDDVQGQRIAPAPDVEVVWAVTSANHQNTRRNPVPYSRREAAIERFSLIEEVRSLVVPVVDARPTDKFAHLTITAIEIATGGRVLLRPDNTVLACSTPEVACLYAELGYRIAAVEADARFFPEPPLRPWDVLERLVSGDRSWADLAHPASVDVLTRYGLDEHVVMVCSDPVVGDEGSLTDTREYGSYQRSFEDDSPRKWQQVGPHVRPGRIVDIGCASGGLLAQAGRDPRLHESDLIGVEVARHLYAEAQHRLEQKGFPNPNTWVYQRNILADDGGRLFPERSIDTTLTVALTHEISSYGAGVADLRRLAERVYRHTVPEGVWVNSDVAGPADPGRMVHLTLAADDGANPERVRTDLSTRAAADCATYVASLSTRARLDQFAHDFAAASPGYSFRDLGDGTVEMTLAGAMEFMTRKDYTDNWVSECCERFTDMNLDSWTALLTDVGFDIAPATHAWTNEWLVANRFDPVARLTDTQDVPLPWPATHVLVVALRPALG